MLHFPRLHPQQLAVRLQTLCRHIPTWPYGTLGADGHLRHISAALRHADTAEAGRELALFAWSLYPLDSRILHIIQQLHQNTPHPRTECGVPDSALMTARQQAQNLLEHDADATQENTPLLQSLLTLQKLLSAHGEGHPWHMWLGTALAQYHRSRKQPAAALQALWPVWQQCPCHPNLVLAVYELSCSMPQNTPPASFCLGKDSSCRPPAILLYSWNKADVLAQTLHSLRRTEVEDAEIFVLNNGSTDDTALLLHSVAAQWGQRFHRVNLPVNIGAPAARNWLLSLPEVQEHEAVVFLDDDLLLDKGWLHGLCAAARAYPQADTVGCRINGHLAPHPIQCADFFMLPPELGDKSFVDLEEQIFLHCAAMGLAGNAGSVHSLLSTYTRPCLSVSGCCHLLRTRGIAQYGAFDLRFNPSQFDDAERDMRLVLQGGQVVYTGHVHVGHVQHSSLKQAHDRAKTAHIFGNKIKLEFLYEARKAQALRETSQQQAQQDLLRKATRLAAREAV